MVIESKDNKRIKYVRKLYQNKYMNEEKKFIIEGEHLVEEAFKAGVLLETYSLEENVFNYNVSNYVVTIDVMKSLSKLKSVPSIIGVCSFIEEKKYLGNKIIMLDGIQDPGNLGTIIRSAKAFNFDTIVLSKTCVSKYNEKVLRATQGMIFNSNIITRDLPEFIEELKRNDYKVYDTLVTDGCDVKNVKTDKIAVVLGSEGLGVSEEVKSKVDGHIYIKMNDACESLNVGVAASIIMYELGE